MNAFPTFVRFVIFLAQNTELNPGDTREIHFRSSLRSQASNPRVWPREDQKYIAGGAACAHHGRDPMHPVTVNLRLKSGQVRGDIFLLHLWTCVLLCLCILRSQCLGTLCM